MLAPSSWPSLRRSARPECTETECHNHVTTIEILHPRRLRWTSRHGLVPSPRRTNAWQGVEASLANGGGVWNKVKSDTNLGWKVEGLS